MITVPFLHDFVDQLPEDLRQRVVALARERKVVKGNPVYHQGDEPTEWFQVVSGAVKLCSYSQDGDELVALELQDGDCFGEMGILDGLPRVSHAIATRTSTLRVWSRADFEKLKAGEPAFTEALMRVMAHRSRLAYCLWVESSGLSLRERLAIALCRLAYGLRGDPASQPIPISQEGLGRMLGASRQTVNKELQRLAGEELIELRHGKVSVVDLDELVERYGYLLGTEPIAASYRSA